MTLPGLPGGEPLRGLGDLLTPRAGGTRGILNTPGLAATPAEPLTAERFADAVRAVMAPPPTTVYLAPGTEDLRQELRARLGLEVVTSTLVPEGQAFVIDALQLEADLTLGVSPLAPLEAATRAQDHANTAMRYELATAMAMPRLVDRPRGDLERRTAERCIRTAHTARRPWRWIRRAMAAAFRAGWHDAIGTTYKTTPPGAHRHHAIISGIA